MVKPRLEGVSIHKIVGTIKKLSETSLIMKCKDNVASFS